MTVVVFSASGWLVGERDTQHAPANVSQWSCYILYSRSGAALRGRAGGTFFFFFFLATIAHHTKRCPDYAVLRSNYLFLTRYYQLSAYMWSAADYSLPRSKTNPERVIKHHSGQSIPGRKSPRPYSVAAVGCGFCGRWLNHPYRAIDRLAVTKVGSQLVAHFSAGCGHAKPTSFQTAIIAVPTFGEVVV